MNKEKEIERLAKDIRTQLSKLESTFWDVFVAPLNAEDNHSEYWKYERQDNETWLYHGTRSLYFKICLFLELKNANSFLAMFTNKFSSVIEDKKKTLESRAGLYNDSEPSMIIHDEFRVFLAAFSEFDYSFQNKSETNKLKLILENTNAIVAKTKTVVTNETSIYKPIKWLTEIVYPNTRGAGKARFIKKFSTYNPDILVPEISSAVEYKYIRNGDNPSVYLNQLKTDADCYEGDPEYKFFYAVVYYQTKSDINPKAFKAAVDEKRFPDSWEILVL